jgi:hypothetical protein
VTKRRRGGTVGFVGQLWIVSHKLLEGAHDPLTSEIGRRTEKLLSTQGAGPSEPPAKAPAMSSVANFAPGSYPSREQSL